MPTLNQICAGRRGNYSRLEKTALQHERINFKDHSPLVSMLMRHVLSLCSITGLAISAPYAEDNRKLKSRTPGNPIPEFDDLIMCFGKVLPIEANWPQDRDPTSYISNQMLCPATSPVPNNVGCRCSKEYGDVQCSQPPADPVLWNAQLDPDGAFGWTDFNGWCVYNCWCGTEDLADLWQAYTPQQQAGADEDEVHDYLGQITAGTIDQLPEGPGLAEWNGTDTLNGHTTGRVSAATFADEGPTYTPKCNASSCEVTSQCSSADCECRVTGARYEPQAGVIEYIAGCAVYISSGLKAKREEEMPCPCNKTYVSHGCCNREANGWVWEAAELKLGELVKTDL